jgi:hypothetical protein
MARSAGAATFESRTSSPSPITTVATAPFRPAATPATVASTTEWPLEAGAGVAADARGISWKIFTRRGRATNAWRARFTREKDGVILHDRGLGAGFTC